MGISMSNISISEPSNDDKEKLFQEVYDQINKRGLPVKFPPSLLSFCTTDDIRQEFMVGVVKRLKKVKTFKEGTGTSPCLGYLLDGGVKSVQDYIRKICNRYFLPHCSCKIWAVKKYDKCPKCHGPIEYTTVFGEEVLSGTARQSGTDKIVESKLEVEKFREFLGKQKAKKAVDLFNILCGKDTGPCITCGGTCSGSISDFEFRRGKWRSGCININKKVGAYWGVSSARIGIIFAQLTSLANKFIGQK